MITAITWLNSCRARIAVAFFATATLASASSAWFTRVWQTDEGLPHNRVNAVAQGADGYLWVGTPAGLARFDGVRFTRFAAAGFAGEPEVRALLPRHKGGLWVVPSQGPVLGVNPELSQAVAPAGDLPETNALAVAEDNEGALWIAYWGGLVCRIKNGMVTRFPVLPGVPNGVIYSLATDVLGDVWMVKGRHVGAFHQEQYRDLVRINAKIRLAPARANGVWIGRDTQLLRCDGQGQLQNCGSFVAQSPHVETLVLLEDHTGAVWIGTDSSGLFRYSESGFEKIETSHPQILSLAEDREGNIWAGTAGGGLNEISRRGVQLEGLGSGAALVAIQSLCEDASGRLWGATQNGLLVCRTNGQWSPALTDAPWNGEVICVAADRSGALWIGTRNRKLGCWRDNAYSVWDRGNGLVSHDVLALLPTASGDVWIAETGLPVLQCLHEGQLRRLESATDFGRPYTLAEDTTGQVWLGSSKGLFRVAGEQVIEENSRTSSAEHPVRCLYPSADGSLWIGYSGWGLGRLKAGRFTRLGMEQGLPNANISQIIGDARGWLWFGTDLGIFKLRQSELDEAMAGRTARLRPIGYGRNEGLQSPSADFGVAPGALRSRDGRVWIPLRRATAAIDPGIVGEEPPGLPPVLLTRVAVDGQTVAAYGGMESLQKTANLKILAGALPVGPGHRKLEVEFTALSFSAPENVHFRYRLEGYEDDWVDAGLPRSATYPRLPAGEYRFRVQACNGDGPWNEPASPLRLAVLPFFWQTWWFRLSVLALFTSAIIATVRYLSLRRFRMELRMVEQQAALDKERSRIARDLHDDLGGSLTQVALVLDMSQRAMAAPDPVNAKLQQCSSMVRQVARSVDEIIWAINPRNDTLPYLIDYVSQYVVEFLHAANIECEVDLPEQIAERMVTPEARHNLFLVVKEALSNIAHHAQASQVWLRVTISTTHLSVELRDNGRGFESTPDNARSDGLRNMRQRMEEIGGRFELESKPGAGTRIGFFYPWPDSR